jgi:hypothetical protein
MFVATPAVVEIFETATEEGRKPRKTPSSQEVYELGYGVTFLEFFELPLKEDEEE